jgi:hypothetical protein
VEQLLKSAYLNDIRRLWNIKSLQFFIYEMPFKVVDLESDDEINAHLDLTAPSKTLTLLAADDSLEVD